MSERIVRIGCGGGAWGDSATAPGQVLRAGIDYLIFDFLAEITMSLLARARARDPGLGYTPDFVAPMMKEALPAIAAGGVKVVSNAGGLNPIACKHALEAVCAEAGIALKVAAVEGDDVIGRIPPGTRDMYDGTPLPARLLTANAYIGARPIAAALAAGADVVITGRVPDSALALGPLIHEFGWRPDDYDRLAGGSVAGHLIECGPQATGGTHTDWDAVPGWDDIGYPIAECRADGSCVITKPAGTGGMVTWATIAEQLCYEIGDPAAYQLPDVVADFSGVALREVGPDRVEVAGARGRPPSGSFKVSATWQDGYRCAATIAIIGPDAVAKAEKTATAYLGRARRILAAAGLPDLTAAQVEVLGSEQPSYGPAARGLAAREVVLRVVAAHPSREALERAFAREIGASGISWAPGIANLLGGRPPVQPVLKLVSFLIDKHALPPPVVTVGDAPGFAVAPPSPILPRSPGGEDPAETRRPRPAPAEEGGERDLVEVPLSRIALARSGDKGDVSNVAIIARRPDYFPFLRRELTAERIARHFAHLATGPVERFELPGIGALNFLIAGALGGGGIASPRIDPQGKAYGQMALEMKVLAPRAWVE